jgi:DinB family protein
MHGTFEGQLEVWADDRRRLLDEVERLEPERLTAKPLAGKWSILEIVEHLVLGDREVFQGLPDPSMLVNRPRRVKDRVGYRLVMFVLACHIPTKVASPRYLPRGQSSLTSLGRDWDEMQQWLRSYVSQLDQGKRAMAVFAHPIAGPLTVQQAFDLGKLHLATHTRQIRRLEVLTKH